MAISSISNAMVKGLVSTESIEDSISLLEEQMTQDISGPQYEFDQLHLNLEKRELEIRQDNPQFNPLTLDGANALSNLEENDPTYQAICASIQGMRSEYRTQVSGWEIPMSTAGDILLPYNS